MSTFNLTPSDVDGLERLVTGTPGEGEQENTVGVRILSGLGQGVPDQTFIRLTDAHFGPNGTINPLFAGVDPRTISNILGTHEASLAKNAAGSNIFFMAFGQYFDHGLDFITKGGAGKITIDGADTFSSTGQPGNFLDLTRATQIGVDADGVPIYQNQTSPLVDQNQAYGSDELVGQFLRESDGKGGFGSRLFAGAPDPSSPSFHLLPTLGELIKHHIAAVSRFGSEGITLLDAHPELLNDDGTINATVAGQLAANFLASGHNLLLDANRGVSVLDHYIAGDGRVNENITLTSMHTVWARNHNFHVENLESAGFQGTPEQLFQAAKMINEAEYQRVVFVEYADALLGGLRGDGDHGFKSANPDADPRISHEFAAAVFRVGHSLISDTLTVKGADGEMQSLLLKDAFLNPGQYKQIGAANILGGIATQQAEEVDFNLVDAVRNDLVGTKADLFAFNVARGWDVGLGTLNQVRKGLLASSDLYVAEARSFAGDLSPYASWEDFQTRNNLSDGVIDQFKAAYPDLVLTPDKLADFVTANPDIALYDGPNGAKIVKGIDRVELWVGGLAEAHINGGQVGQTFWVVLHEQLDRLQEADRFYYINRFDNFDLYDGEFEEVSLAGIVARTTGLTGLAENIFSVTSDDVLGDGQTDNDETEADNDETEADTDETEADADETEADTEADETDPEHTDEDLEEGTTTPVAFEGSDEDDVAFGGGDDDDLTGGKGDDAIFARSGDDRIAGGEGDDDIEGGSGNNTASGGEGHDRIFSGNGNDKVYGGAGNDRIETGGGHDRIWGGAGRDVIDAGDGDDEIYASGRNDGHDSYDGGDGIDTINYEEATANLTIDLQGRMARGADIGEASLDEIENVVGGGGNDTIIADDQVNILRGGGGRDTFVFREADDADGDRIEGFQTGDKVNLSSIFGDTPMAFVSGTFNAAGQIRLANDEDGNTIVEGSTDRDADAEFTLVIMGQINKNDVI